MEVTINNSKFNTKKKFLTLITGIAFLAFLFTLYGGMKVNAAEVSKSTSPFSTGDYIRDTNGNPLSPDRYYKVKTDVLVSDTIEEVYYWYDHGDMIGKQWINLTSRSSAGDKYNIDYSQEDIRLGNRLRLHDSQGGYMHILKDQGQISWVPHGGLVTQGRGEDANYFNITRADHRGYAYALNDGLLKADIHNTGSLITANRGTNYPFYIEFEPIN